MNADDRSEVRRVLALYPQIWHACHVRHPRAAEKAGGVSERESSILAHLHEERGMRQNVLARHLGLGASTLSEALDALAARDLVRRVRREDDRRAVELYLTAKGGRMLEKGTALDPARVRAALAQLAPRQRARAIEGLSLIARACRTLTEPKGARR